MRMVEVALSEFNNEPVFFKLAGESFECLSYVPAGVQTDLAQYDYSLPKTLAFIEAILKDEAELKRFQKFIHGTKEIHQAVLTKTLEELIGVYSARPLVKPSRSAVGQKNTSRSSKPRSKHKGAKSSP